MSNELYKKTRLGSHSLSPPLPVQFRSTPNCLEMILLMLNQSFFKSSYNVLFRRHLYKSQDLYAITTRRSVYDDPDMASHYWPKPEYSSVRCQSSMGCEEGTGNLNFSPRNSTMFSIIVLIISTSSCDRFLRL